MRGFLVFLIVLNLLIYAIATKSEIANVIYLFFGFCFITSSLFSKLKAMDND